MDAARAHTLEQRNDARERFISQAVQAVVRLADRADAETLAEALRQTSPVDVLVTALLRQLGSLGAEGSAAHPLTGALLRGQLAKRRLLEAGGGTLSSAEVARLLGVSRQTVNNRRLKGRLIGVPSTRGDYEYPAWQFADGGVLPGLERVLMALRDHHPWTQLSYMLNPDSRLGDRTPLEVLRQGRADDVVAAASMYGEQGAA
ncbi:MAG: hypothetical protein ACYC5O_14620 [Anaerolineae bacterium]